MDEKSWILNVSTVFLHAAVMISLSVSTQKTANSAYHHVKVKRQIQNFRNVELNFDRKQNGFL